MALILLPFLITLTVSHLQNGVKGMSLKDRAEFQETSQKEDLKYSTDYCSCSEIECTCCSDLGPPKICNVIKIANNVQGTKEDLSLELTIEIANSKVFTQNISLQELEPICYPYGDRNFCVQFDIKKNLKGNGKLCGSFLAKDKGNYSKEETTLLKSEIFCLQLGAEQLTNNILELLRLISQ